MAERIEEVDYETQVTAPDQERNNRSIKYVNDPIALELGLVDPKTDAGQ